MTAYRYHRIQPSFYSFPIFRHPGDNFCNKLGTITYKTFQFSGCSSIGTCCLAWHGNTWWLATTGIELLNVPAFYIKISGCFYKILLCMTTRTLDSSLCSTKHPVLCLYILLLYYRWGGGGGSDRSTGSRVRGGMMRRRGTTCYSFIKADLPDKPCDMTLPLLFSMRHPSGTYSP